MPAKREKVVKDETPAPGEEKKKNISRSERAGLAFPVGRMNTIMKGKKGLQTQRVSAGTPVFLAATLEYLCAEILELSGNHCLNKNRRRVKPRDIFLAVDGDAELGELFEDALICAGGVKEFTNPLLENKPKGKKKSKKAGPTMEA